MVKNQKPYRISGRFLMIKTLMRFPLPLPIIGIHPPLSWLYAAGKQVYVEKPCGHNPEEGEMLVAAAKKIWSPGANGQPTAFVA